MKNIFLTLTITTLVVFSACKGDTAAGKDKKTQLAELKKQQLALNEQIAKLEKELSAGDTTRKVKTFYVQVTTATPSVFNHYVEMQGAVVADDEYALNAKVPGAITRTNLKVGDRVTAGQVVAEIDDEMLRTQIEEIKKRWELANDVYQKQEALWKQNIGSEVQYLSAKNNKEALEKGMATVEKSRELYRIVAPISGVVDETSLHVGMVVAPGAPLAKIVNFSKLKLKADVPESYAGKVRQGNSVVVSFPDLKKDISGKIGYVGASVNPTNRTFKVEVPLKANEKDLLPNMAGILKVADYSNSKAFSVPINILKKDLDGSDFVLIEKDGKAAKAVVKVGQYYGDNAEILSGLKAGDKLITTGFEDLSEGDAVQVTLQ
jgi:membrane fusion protein, multidrug efflux system